MSFFFAFVQFFPFSLFLVLMAIFSFFPMCLNKRRKIVIVVFFFFIYFVCLSSIIIILFTAELFASIFQLTRSRFCGFDWNHNWIICHIKHEMLSDAIQSDSRDSEINGSHTQRLLFNNFFMRFPHFIRQIIDIFEETKSNLFIFFEKTINIFQVKIPFHGWKQKKRIFTKKKENKKT